MSLERILKIIAQQNVGRVAVRNAVNKGVRGGIGFCEPNPAPIISETFPVVGEPYFKQTKDGLKQVFPKARFVVFESGETDIISGGVGAPVEAKDLGKMLDRSGKTKLKNSLKHK